MTGMTAQNASCLHCDAPVKRAEPYCCAGCKAAHEFQALSTPDFSFHDCINTDDTGTHSLTLVVQGMHCGGCIQKIERTIKEHPQVSFARVNMSTERVKYSWKGARERGDAIAKDVMDLGYQLRSLDQQSLMEAPSEEKILLKSIALSGFAAGNIMLLSVGVWSTTGETMGFATRDLFHWLSAMIAIPTVLFAGRPFFRSALSVLKRGQTNMDVPISLAIVLACCMSLFETINSGEHVYFDSAVMLVFFLLTGRYLDARAKGKARQSASNLLSKLTGTAMVLEDNKTTRVAASELQPSMIVLVAAGENFPADGVVISGTSEVDLSLISGESLPKPLTVGAGVYAGTLNLVAPVKFRVSEAREETLLSKIVRMMETAEQGNAKYIRLADKMARLYTPVVHLVSLMTLLGWLFLLDAQWQVAMLHAVTVLIITCPCALGLAVPIVQVLASGRLMRHGILLKSGDALEKLAEIDTVIFDKTGTLTQGNLDLLPGLWSRSDLQLAASLGAKSRHPLSRAISKAYKGKIHDLDVEEVPGKGISGCFRGETVKLGSHLWVDTIEGSDVTTASLWLKVGDHPPRQFLFTDQLRADSNAVIDMLHALSIDIHILSGDRRSAVKQVANDLNITHFTAETSPLDKCDYIDALQQAGRKILFVGDGLNDAPALAKAYVSMSPSSAVDISQTSADIIFQGDALMPVIRAFKTARISKTLVKQNFALAIMYNIFAVPIAMAGFITPLIAAIAMSGSSLVVVANAFRLNLPQSKEGV